MLTAGQWVGALALLKAVDVAARGPQQLSPLLHALSLALLVAGGAGLLLCHRAGWVAVLVAGVALATDYPLDLRRQHLVLLIAICLGALASRTVAERLVVWRVLLRSLYGVAALAKVNESFLGGDVLATALAGAPLGARLLPGAVPLVVLGVLVIAAEALLAVTPWVARWRRPGTALAAVLHGAALPLLATSASVGLRLLVFGGLAVVLHAASAGLLQVGPVDGEGRRD